MRLEGHGIAARLPAGWEGSIAAHRQGGLDVAAAAHSDAGRARGVLPVAHFATFALPAMRGDFGSNVVDAMRPADAFISLVEYGPEEAGSALFSSRGLPRRLDPRSFSPKQLQRTIAGQAGLQIFFTSNDRAFCLYVVIGDAGDAHRLVRRVEQVLADIELTESA